MTVSRFFEIARRIAHGFAVMVATSVVLSGADRPPSRVIAERLTQNPIISEKMLPGDDGDSINGPSLIRVPAWVKNPLGKYYLYFAHHAGKYLRFAHADRLEGPWTIREGGVLRLTDQHALANHIASPDAVIDEMTRRIFLFYHGRPAVAQKKEIVTGDSEAGQKTSVAVSTDGVHFTPLDVIVGPAYLRVFAHGGRWFALNHSGELRVADELGKPFVTAARIVGDDIAAAVDPLKLGEPDAPTERAAHGADRYSIRHVGVEVAGDWLNIYFSCVGHRPERILCTTVALAGPPDTWRAQGVSEVLRPEKSWEGADQPLVYSKGGRSREWENGLRDPAVFREGTDAWLIYATAGEHGLALARLRYVEAR